jgi:hypothetical protein
MRDRAVGETEKSEVSVRAFAPKDLQYSLKNSSVCHPCGSRDPGDRERRKREKNGKKGIKPGTSRPWVPACVGMTEMWQSQRKIHSLIPFGKCYRRYNHSENGSGTITIDFSGAYPA